MEQMFHRIDYFECVECGKQVDLVNKNYTCEECLSVSPSNGSKVEDEESPYPIAKDALDAVTEALRKADQEFPAPTEQELQVREYRRTYLHMKETTAAREQRTLEELVHYG